MQWYYAQDGERKGPVEDEAMQNLVRSGLVTSETLVWNPQMTGWQPFSAVAHQLPMPAGAPAGASPYAVADAPAATPASSFDPFAEMQSGQASCSECGRSFAENDMVSYGGRFVCAECKPRFFQKLREGVPAVGELNYAGFWVRFLAKFVDGILLQIILLPINFLMPTQNSEDPMLMLRLMGTSSLIGFVIQACYYVFFHGRFGATPGKMALRLKVVRPDGESISYGRALGRYFAEFLSSIIFLIGYIMAAFDDEKRSLHDRICDTRVIRKS